MCRAMEWESEVYVSGHDENMHDAELRDAMLSVGVPDIFIRRIAVEAIGLRRRKENMLRVKMFMERVRAAFEIIGVKSTRIHMMYEWSLEAPLNHADILWWLNAVNQFWLWGEGDIIHRMLSDELRLLPGLCMFQLMNKYILKHEDVGFREYLKEIFK